jgi:transcriptional regulator with XRE-family HTH domain
VHDARRAAGLSQTELARRAGVSADKVWRLEHERSPNVTIADACVLGAVVGLDFSARSYPSGALLRDASQAVRLVRVLAHVHRPLRYPTDVPLPRTADAPELRVRDAIVEGRGERTGIELETRITDFQAVTRRHNEKRSHDPVDHFVLLVADTNHN